MPDEGLKVGELARRTGLTVRTLHHYDEIDLLRPSLRTEAGYRLYTADDLARLQQVLSLRQLGFSLEEVRDCLNGRGFSPLEVIRLHLERLREQIEMQRGLCERLEALAHHFRAAEKVSADEFIQTIEEMTRMEKYYHPTSVKTIFIVQRPSETEPGIADFRFNPVFSVFDYGTLQPPVPLDNSTIALMAAYNFERLREAGIESHYIAMVHEGEAISAAEAIRRGLAPDTLRVRLVNRLLPTHTATGWDYSVFHRPPSNHFVVPIEFISRVKIGANSSVWKRVSRGEISLADLGLPTDIRPGDPLPSHVLDYSTKYEPEDRYVSVEEARAITGFPPERWARINQTTAEVSRLMTELARSRGVEREDGKVEYVTLDHRRETDVLGDAVTTLHEDRLILDGTDITKQAIRNAVKQCSPEWAAEIDRAKTEARRQGVPDFRALMDPAIRYVSPPAELFNRYDALARAFANHWIDAVVYPEDRDLSQRLREFRAVL